MAQFDMKDATIVLQDGSTPPKMVALEISEGTFSYTEHNTMEYVTSRGRIGSVKRADEEPIDVSFTVLWEELTSNDPLNPSFEDALKFRGPAAGWVSTDDDPCRPPALDLVLYMAPPCGEEGATKITIPDFRWETLNHDGGAATIAVDGRSNAKEVIIEPLVLTIEDVDFTPTSVTAGQTIAVTWKAEFLNNAVTINLVPASGTEIYLGSATASDQKATVRIPSDTAAATDYKVKVLNAQSPTMFAVSTAELTVTTP